MLDGYYLYQERLYRKLYSHVRKQEVNNIDFDMNAIPFKGKDGATWVESVMSKTMLMFHGILIVTIIIVMLVCIDVVQ